MELTLPLRHTSTALPTDVSGPPGRMEGLNDIVGRAVLGAPRGLDMLGLRLQHNEIDLGAIPARERVLTLTAIYELLCGPVHAASRWAAHPTLASVRWQLEQSWIDELNADLTIDVDTIDETPCGTDAQSVVAALRRIAATDRLPAVYKTLAQQGTLEELVHFLAIEGGPDAGFDDLVAACQIGLGGAAKIELAANYWDEMGNGDPAKVHTTLHDQLVDALAMPRLPRSALPVEALERSALCSMLAANHWLQPEMLGALGLIELQAGPRCRLVVRGLDRVGAPAAAKVFYQVHADVDPRHGKDWLEHAIVPVLAEHPQWGPRIVAGARWRSTVNARFYAWAQTDVTTATNAPAEPE